MLARKGRQELPDSGRGSADLDAQDRCRRLDMDEAKAGALTVDRDEPDPDWDHAFADVVGDLDPRPAPRAPGALGAGVRGVSRGASRGVAWRLERLSGARLLVLGERPLRGRQRRLAARARAQREARQPLLSLCLEG